VSRELERLNALRDLLNRVWLDAFRDDDLDRAEHAMIRIRAISARVVVVLRAAGYVK